MQKSVGQVKTIWPGKRLIVGLAVILIQLLAGCNNREIISPSAFREKMQMQGYEVIDKTDDYAEHPFITEAQMVEAEGLSIECMSSRDSDQAAAIYQQNRDYLDTLSGSSSSVTINDYQEYSRTTKEVYYKTFRVGTMSVYAYCDEADKAVLEKILDEVFSES